MNLPCLYEYYHVFCHHVSNFDYDHHHITYCLTYVSMGFYRHFIAEYLTHRQCCFGSTAILGAHLRLVLKFSKFNSVTQTAGIGLL